MKNIHIGVVIAIVSFVGIVVAQEPGLYEDEFTERPSHATALITSKDDTGAEKKPERKKKRRCVRCAGKGKTISVTRQDCDRCGGSGIMTSEIELKDTINGRYWWQGNYRTTRKTVNKQPCPHCNRSGRITVKKETECSLCGGTGSMP